MPGGCRQTTAIDDVRRGSKGTARSPQSRGHPGVLRYSLRNRPWSGDRHSSCSYQLLSAPEADAGASRCRRPSADSITRESVASRRVAGISIGYDYAYKACWQAIRGCLVSTTHINFSDILCHLWYEEFQGIFPMMHSTSQSIKYSDMSNVY